MAADKPPTPTVDEAQGRCSNDSRPDWRRRSWRFVIRLLIVYSLFMAMLAFLQRSLIYFPAKSSDIVPAMAGFLADEVEAVTAHTEDGLTLHGWYLTAPSEPSSEDRDDARERRVVLYFPGNAGNRSYRGEEAKVFLTSGADVLIFDYRGYGENDGSPSEEGLAADARAAWKFAANDRRIPPERIVICGESLGGGVATRLAAELCAAGTPPVGLILRSTFSSLIDTAGHHYPWVPVRLLLRDRYRSDDHIRSVTCPILVVHGTRDTIVPCELGRRLFAAAPERSSSGVPKAFVEFGQADHNDILTVAKQEYAEAVRNFLLALDRGAR